MDEFNMDEAIKKLGDRGLGQSPKRTEESSDKTLLDAEQMEQVLVLCQSKAEEFALFGYDKVSKKEIWRYFESRYRKENPPLHRLVNEILGLKITTYMNWITINSYKGL